MDGEDLRGQTILVTGGTGCIGEQVIEEALRGGADRIVSVSRGRRQPTLQRPEVEYLFCDIRSGARIAQLMKAIRPDVVVHLAAVRDPGYAESHVVEAITTNVVGSRNVFRAAGEMQVPSLRFASTGKALRFWTPGVYAGSKKLVEYLASTAASDYQIPISGMRFTHIVDNSIVYQLIQSWARSGSPVRLHGHDVAFYVQSAREAAQLLLSHRASPAREIVEVVAQRDLGWPIELEALARDVIAAHRSRSDVEFIGAEDGYELECYPGTYDFRKAGECSPLLNAIEVQERLDVGPAYDAFLLPCGGGDELVQAAQGLERAAAANAAPGEVVERLQECGVLLLRWRLAAAPTAAIKEALPAVPDAAWCHGHRLIYDEMRGALEARSRGGGS